jgi:4-hydroxythreonine-4-phosphate dehydrogenase
MKTKELPVVGISIGDYNGIGPEVVLKAFSDNRLFDQCVAVVYASPKIIHHYKHLLQLDKLQHQVLKSKDPKLLSNKGLNIVNCLDDEFEIQPGEDTPAAGKAAITLLDEAMADLKSGYIDVLVTAPLNKHNIKIEGVEFTGHTEYITRYFNVQESMMFLVDDTLRVGLVTNHIPIKDVVEKLNAKLILQKLEIMHHCLERDFAIERPKIAVLGLNPHAGDNGLIGKEEKEIIIPAIHKAQEAKIMAFGPYPADGFFGSGAFKKFDAVLAMYHDQGLVAFKSMGFGNGVNYTAGLPVIRTSPDHGTAYDIAGKGLADENSLREAIFTGIDALRARRVFDESHAKPLEAKEKRSERD